uniref:uncharacterized protein n=1 Tax=Pristiophorus japonicus TaxID=55135 RepID=UPI00398F2BBE
MKGLCRVCGSNLQGNQRRWIFNTSGKRRFQIILSCILGYTVSRDGQGEFLCSKCAFMLEKVLKYDIVIARVKTVASERLQMLTTEKEQLIQCIVHLYFRFNEEANISQYKARGISTEDENQTSLQYSLLLQDESVLSEFWTPGRSNKDSLGCSSCWRSFTGGHRMRKCRSSDSLRVADLFCDLVCSTPRRTMRRGLTGNARPPLLGSQSQSMCFDLVPRSSCSARKPASHIGSRQVICTDNLETESMTTLNSTRIDWITDEDSEKVPLKSTFDRKALTENYLLLRQSIANAIQEIKDIDYKPVPSLSRSKIPKCVKLSARRPASGCSIATALQETYNLNGAKSVQELWEELEDEYAPLKTEVVDASSVCVCVCVCVAYVNISCLTLVLALCQHLEI